MSLIDEYRILIGAYYGIQSMDNYDSKEFLLKEIREYINSFLEIHKNDINFDYKNEEQIYNRDISLKTKLQDSLILLNRMNADIDIILLVKEKLRLLNKM